MYLRSSFFHATFQEDSDSHHPQKAFFVNLKQHPTVPNILCRCASPSRSAWSRWRGGCPWRVGARSSQGHQGQSQGGVVRVVGWMMVGIWIRKKPMKDHKFRLWEGEKKTHTRTPMKPPQIFICWHLSFSPLQRFSIGEGAMLNRKPPSMGEVTEVVIFGRVRIIPCYTQLPEKLTANSSPLKIGPNCTKRQLHRITTIHFQVQAISFREGKYHWTIEWRWKSDAPRLYGFISSELSLYLFRYMIYNVIYIMLYIYILYICLNFRYMNGHIHTYWIYIYIYIVYIYIYH